MRPLLLVLLLASTVAGCAAPRRAAPDPVTLRAELIAADLAFAADAAARGMDGWVAHFTSDAVRLRLGGTSAAGTVVQGLDAVRAYDASFFADPAARVEWAPTEAGAFADGMTGFTTGRAAMVRRAGGAVDTLWTGTYISLWRRGADGRWRVFLDTGA